MKKEEKTRQTCQKILNAAISEFGTQSYEAVSLNTICKKYQISKGLIYHNFENKDFLYLACVKECFEKLTAYLKSHEQYVDNIEEGIKNILIIRRDFFYKNTNYKNIFFNVILYPTIHLEKEIKEITHEYNNYIRACYQNLLSKVKLRNGITLDMAVDYLCVFQDIYNGYYQRIAFQKGTYIDIIDDHEIKISKLLEIILYGISTEK